MNARASTYPTPWDAVLIIDDQEEVRELLASALQAPGFGVRTATNGLERWCVRMLEDHLQRSGLIPSPVSSTRTWTQSL